jgi:hypothetical protein
MFAAAASGVASRVIVCERVASLLPHTCGALLHNGELIIPYGLADHATGIATVPLGEVLAAVEQEEPVSK